MHYKLEKPIHGIIGTEKYQCAVEWRNGKFIADEPAIAGGADKGPDPYTLLLSSLATCTLITLRMYIDRKGWAIPQITVNVNMYHETIGEIKTSVFDRDIIFPAGVDEDKKTRLKEIADQCPISKILAGPAKVHTFIFKEGPSNH